VSPLTGRLPRPFAAPPRGPSSFLFDSRSHRVLEAPLAYRRAERGGEDGERPPPPFLRPSPRFPRPCQRPSPPSHRTRRPPPDLLAPPPLQTIIECLKQACTGELPPNCRSGHTFIHDPKISGDHEVKGQIKLRLGLSSGAPLVAVRSFQLKQTARGAQFKSLDASILTKNKVTGKPESISYKCAEVDRLLPSLMGVSKAVLENVIFVHQEDAAWPLAEGAVLKKKFDDIFAATKYTKALEQFSKLLKEQKQKVKENKLKMESCKILKDQAEKLRAEQRDHGANIEVFQRQIQEHEGTIAQQQAALDEAQGKLRQIGDLRGTITDLQARHEVKHKQLAEARARLSAEQLEEIEDTLEDLERMLAEEVESKLAVIRGEIQALKHEISVGGRELAAMKDSYAEAFKRQGRLAAEVDQLSALQRERDKYLSQQATQFGVTGVGVDPRGRLDGEQVAHALSSLDKEVAKQAERTAALKRRHREADDRLGARMDELSAQLAQCGETARLALRRREQAERQCAEIEARLGDMPSGEAAVEDAQRRERAAKDALSRRDEEAASQDLDARLDALALQVEDATRKTHRLRSRRDQLQQAAQSTARLRVKRQDLQSKEQQLRSIVTGGRSKVEAALGVPAGTDLHAMGTAALVATLRGRAGAAREAAEAAEREAQGLAREAASKEAGLRHKRAEVAALGAEEERVKADLDALMGVATRGQPGELSQGGFEERVRALEEEVVETKSSMALGGGMADVWGTMLEKGRKKHRCELCKRGLSEAEVPGYERECQKLRQKAIDYQGAGRRAELDDKEGTLRQFQAAQPKWARLRDLQMALLPRARDEERALADACAALRARLEEAEALAEGERAGAVLAETVAAEVGGPLERTEEEVRALRKEVDDLAVLAGAAGAADDLDAVTASLDAEEQRRAGLEREREALMRAQASARDAHQAAQNAWRDAREEVTRTQAAAEEAKRLREQARALAAEGEAAAAECEQQRAAERPLQEQARALEADRKRLRGEHRAAEEAAEEKERGVRQVADRARQLRQQCDAMAAKGSAEELRKVNEEIERRKAQQVRRGERGRAGTVTGPAPARAIPPRASVGTPPAPPPPPPPRRRRRRRSWKASARSSTRGSTRTSARTPCGRRCRPSSTSAAWSARWRPSGSRCGGPWRSRRWWGTRGSWTGRRGRRRSASSAPRRPSTRRRAAWPPSTST